MMKSLEGHIQFEQVFILKQAVKSYEFLQSQIDDLDAAIDDILSQLDKQADSSQEVLVKKRVSPSQQRQLFEITGVDMLQVPSISALALHKLMGETGLDMSAWKSSKHFTS